jgi:hypothetical protein
VFGAGYVFSSTELALRGYVFTRRPQNVEIVYTAGYPIIPSDIAQACIDMVCLRYRERTRIGEVSRAISGNETVTYSQRDMTEHVKLLLSQYRLVTPISTFRQVAPTATDPALLAAAL